MAEERKEIKEEKTLKENNTSALIGFILSLTGCLAIPGFLFSFIALVTCNEYKNKRKGLAIAGLVISSILIIISINIYNNKNNTNSNSNTKNDNYVHYSINSNSEPEKIEYTKVDIDTMEKDLDNNAAAAKETYNGKHLEITGKLGTIDSDLKYISLLSLTDEWDIIGIHCTLVNQTDKDMVKTLTKNQTIIVRGKITDVGEVLGYYLDVEEIIAQ